jgi:SPP1 gp7 family putative phage head morphogenesis protein
MARKMGDASQRLIDNLRALQNKFEAERPFKRDAWIDDFRAVFDATEGEFYRSYSDVEIRNMALRMGISVEEFNRRQMEKMWRRVTGVDVIASEPWLAAELQNAVERNVALIKSIPEQYFQQLETGILDRFSQGQRWEDIAEWIEERTGVAESRANTIARDQVGKLNGTLGELRMRSAEVKKYIWRTSLDERVRPDHQEREGKIFSWSDPPEDGHPGQPINCRCSAEPVFEDSDTE